MATQSLASESIDEASTVPIYTMAEAADIIRVSPSTFRNWALGYHYPLSNQNQHYSSSLVELAAPPGSGPSVPFVGLAEGYMLAAFTQAGVPMQRIRPAIEWLRNHMSVEHALASQRLYTDGAEVLYEYGRTSGDPADADLVEMLVVVRNQQGVFRQVVQDYLKAVTYKNGFVNLIDLKGYRGAKVIVSPRINFGAPTLARRRIKVADIRSRVSAGETFDAVADDYELEVDEVAAVVQRRGRAM